MIGVVMSAEGDIDLYAYKHGCSKACIHWVAAIDDIGASSETLCLVKVFVGDGVEAEVGREKKAAVLSEW